MAYIFHCKGGKSKLQRREKQITNWLRSTPQFEIERGNSTEYKYFDFWVMSARGWGWLSDSFRTLNSNRSVLRPSLFCLWVIEMESTKLPSFGRTTTASKRELVQIGRPLTIDGQIGIVYFYCRICREIRTDCAWLLYSICRYRLF